MLKTEGISFSIGSKPIVKDISVEFLPGEFNMILGPNGSGKSTFLKIFSGELKGYGGHVWYNGETILQQQKQEIAKYRAVMSQQPDLTFPLTVEEVVMMGRYPHFNYRPFKRDETVCAEVMTRMNLHDFKDRNYLTLSGGEKQRVQFARVLAQIWDKPASGTRFLFLDEPLNNLDISYQQELLQIAREFGRHETVLVAVMHDINLAIQYADRLFFMKEGRMVASGKPKEVLTETLIRDVFNVSVNLIANPLTGDPLLVFG